MGICKFYVETFQVQRGCSKGIRYPQVTADHDRPHEPAKDFIFVLGTPLKGVNQEIGMLTFIVYEFHLAYRVEGELEARRADGSLQRHSGEEV
jgi:hypothetical protein